MRILIFTAFLFYCTGVQAQNTETDSLKAALAIERNDEDRIIILESLSYAYLSSYPDTALKYALQGLQLAQDINFTRGQAICINAIGNVYFHIGDNATALEMYLQYLKLKESIKDFKNISVAYYNIGSVYTENKDYSHALYYLFKAKHADERLKDSIAILYDTYAIGTTYLRMQQEDSALYYLEQSCQLAEKQDDRNMLGAILNTFGEAYLALNKTGLATKYYSLSIPYAQAINDNEVLTSNYFGLAKIFKQKNTLDSSIFYGRKALSIATTGPFFKQMLELSDFLAEVFSMQHRYDSAFYYQRLSIATKDSVFNNEQARKVQNLKFDELQRQQAIENEKIAYQNKIKLYTAIFISVVILGIAIILWRNNKHKQKTNELLRKQNEEIETQRDTLENALERLQSTQTQLIHSEKMASLGELTAGIAHEIQNPLNFVNNFSEVNKEMIIELKEEINKGNYNEVKNIADHIQENEGKIIHHGRRADAIVKGMLQHSRTSSGQKEPTDINALCDEYLGLSYHGLRARDKSFKADFKTDFDETLSAGEAGTGKANIVSRDIGRVLLNLFNNAFYAVNEKSKNLSALQDLTGLEQYHPTVSVQTKKLNDAVEIKVKDNGNGIPQNIIDKIFQPFFTTKPTGQGTGLGLSLAYDIIKAHGGEIKVETKEGEGSEFIIQLPIV